MTQKQQCPDCGGERFSWRIIQWETGVVVSHDGTMIREHRTSGEIAGTARDDALCAECGARHELDDLDSADTEPSASQ